ncbi:hypothetical protein ACPCG0_00990 [Propionibacteriaceae bacterium Y1923]|uniref:HD domain-containing protein n=1 Tax=Aestuariimicrobium sp. Y1814 TaxID=3418742 RepID=UPI003C234705
MKPAGFAEALVGLGADQGDDRLLAVGRDLWQRWHEPHRDYHGVSHLRSGLAALSTLGAGPLEVVAWWFHDAVHHNDPPWDEQSSAALARELLAGLLPDETVTQVARLVLLTINHDPAADDAAGQRLCDADLVLIAAEPRDYRAGVAALRTERPQLSQPEWDALRIAQTGMLLNRAQLFHTDHGRLHWEQPARRNLTDERRMLFSPAARRAAANPEETSR